MLDRGTEREGPCREGWQRERERKRGKERGRKRGKERGRDREGRR